MLPKLKLEFEPQLAELDMLLEDDELFKLIKADLLKRYPSLERPWLSFHAGGGDLTDVGGQETLWMEL